MTIYYVYSYRDPLSETPFYIGKGSGNRKFKHLKETKDNTENYLKWCKIRSILNRGDQPHIEVLFEFETELEAYDKEASLISYYGRIGFEPDGCLTNRCIDSRPPTYAAKMPRSEEYRKNMSKAKLAEKNPMFGKEPWNKGKSGYSTSKKGQKRKWITDGISSRQILASEEIPSGWKVGRTGGAKGSRRGMSNT
jgi:hypothetical protein